MKIRFQSRHGHQRVFARNFLGNPLGEWTNGQEVDVPDDLEIDFRVFDGGPIRRVKAVDAILSLGPDFVDAATNVNPDFADQDGRETVSDAFLDPATMSWVPYEDEDGNRLSVLEFLARNPRYIYAHRRYGIDESVAAEAERLSRERGTAVVVKHSDAPPPLAGTVHAPQQAQAVLEADAPEGHDHE